MSGATWRRTIGAGIARPTAPDAAGRPGVVTVRPAWDGGTRVTVHRYAPPASPDHGVIGEQTHARRFPR